MTPHQYLKLARDLDASIERLKKVKERCMMEALECPPPTKRRPAKAEDIQEGAIIWHTRAAEYGGDYWNVVDEVRDPHDSFKAYVADDGCRYGLDGAYIDLDPLRKSK